MECVCVCFSILGAGRAHLLPPPPTPGRAFCSPMMYETASPLEYHRNMTAAQQRCPVMETDGMAPALLTLSTTMIELARHSRLRQGPLASVGRGPRKRGLHLLAAHVCRPRWVPPPPDRWMDEQMTYGRMRGGCSDGRRPAQVFVKRPTVDGSHRPLLPVGNS